MEGLFVVLIVAGLVRVDKGEVELPDPPIGQQRRQSRGGGREAQVDLVHHSRLLRRCT